MAERTFEHVKTMEYVDGVAYPKIVEYFEGEKVEPVSPRATHAIVQFAMLRILRGCAGDRGRALPEWDFYPAREAGKKVKVVPDAAFVSFERLHRLSKREREAPPFAPEVAIEVWSPGSSRPNLDTKISIYLANGSALVLDVDPYKRTIVAHAIDGVRSFRTGEEFSHDVVPWLRFDVSEAFEELDDLIR